MHTHFRIRSYHHDDLYATNFIATSARCARPSISILPIPPVETRPYTSKETLSQLQKFNIQAVLSKIKRIEKNTHVNTHKGVIALRMASSRKGCFVLSKKTSRLTPEKKVVHVDALSLQSVISISQKKISVTMSKNKNAHTVKKRNIMIRTLSMGKISMASTMRDMCDKASPLSAWKHTEEICV
jgi:hypothetical protein